jgi:ketosteroid isomerase-like protein
MSKENVETIREHFEATNRRDYELAISHFAPDLELVVPPGALNAGRYRGRTAVVAFFGDWFRTFGDTQHFELREVIDTGDAVVVVARHRAEGERSGAPAFGELSYAYWLEDGKIREVHLYQSQTEALVAAGLRE